VRCIPNNNNINIRHIKVSSKNTLLVKKFACSYSNDLPSMAAIKPGSGILHFYKWPLKALTLDVNKTVIVSDFGRPSISGSIRSIKMYGWA
jgi:hypothetical protein